MNDLYLSCFRAVEIVHPEKASTHQDLAEGPDEIVSFPRMGSRTVIFKKDKRYIVASVLRRSATKGKTGIVSFAVTNVELPLVQQWAETRIRIPAAVPLVDAKWMLSRALRLKTPKLAAVRLNTALQVAAEIMCTTQGSDKAWATFRRIFLTALGAAQVCKPLFGLVRNSFPSLVSVFYAVESAAPTPLAPTPPAMEAELVNPLESESVREDDTPGIAFSLDSEACLEEGDDVAGVYNASALDHAETVLGDEEDHGDNAGGDEEDDDEPLCVDHADNVPVPIHIPLDLDTYPPFISAANKLVNIVYNYKSVKTDATWLGHLLEKRAMHYVRQRPFTVESSVFTTGFVRAKDLAFGCSPDGLCLTRFPTDTIEVPTIVESKFSKTFSLGAVDPSVPIFCTAGDLVWHREVAYEFKWQLMHQAATLMFHRSLLVCVKHQGICKIVVVAFTLQQLTEYRAFMNLPLVHSLTAHFAHTSADDTYEAVVARLPKCFTPFNHAMVSSWVPTNTLYMQYWRKNGAVEATESDRDLMTHMYDAHKGGVDGVCSLLQDMFRVCPITSAYDGKVARASVFIAAAGALRLGSVVRVGGQILPASGAPLDCSLAKFRRLLSRDGPFLERLDAATLALLKARIVLGQFEAAGSLTTVPRPVVQTPILSALSLERRILAAYPEEIATHLRTRARVAERPVGDFLAGNSPLVLDDAMLRATPGQRSPAEVHMSKAATLGPIVRTALGLSGSYAPVRRDFWKGPTADEPGGPGHELRLRTPFLLHLRVSKIPEIESKRLQCGWCWQKKSVSSLVACALCGEKLCGTADNPCFDQFHTISAWHGTVAFNTLLNAVASPVVADDAEGATESVEPESKRLKIVPGARLWQEEHV